MFSILTGLCCGPHVHNELYALQLGMSQLAGVPASWSSHTRVHHLSLTTVLDVNL